MAATRALGDGMGVAAFPRKTRPWAGDGGLVPLGAGVRPVRRIGGRMQADAPGDSCYLRSSGCTANNRGPRISGWAGGCH